MLPGCDAGGVIEIPTNPNGGAGGWNGGDGGTIDAPSTTDTGGSTGGSIASPVLVAITPTPASLGGEPSPADVLGADLTTFGAGVRAVVIAMPWDTVVPGEDPALADRAAFYASHDKRVLLNLAVVDRAVDRRPEEVKGKLWNSPETLTAVRDAIDALLSSTGDEVRYLTLGRDVDVYLAAHPDDRPYFIAFAKEACAYAKGHADAPADLHVGVAFTALAPKTETAFTDLLPIEDVAAFSYFPGLGTFEPNAASGVAATIASLADAAQGKPIVLQAAGFATDELAAGSDAAQQDFYKGLFTAIGGQNESFALVDVVELYDAPHAACAAWAQSQGETLDGPLAAYACSLGLFRNDGTPKPAWSAVLAGAAALASP